MKRKYVYFLALSALTLGACSNETDSFGDAPDGTKQGVTFLFPGTAQGVVPYAAGIASEEENKIETLDVYVFGADKLATTDPRYLLEDVIKLESTDLTDDTDAKKATVSIVGTNAKCLYFVANGRSQTSLGDYELGVTDTLAFVKKQTRSLGIGLVKSPLLMTARYAFKLDGDGKMDLAGTHSISLNRRVARFDIINDSEESTLKIEKVLIKSARPGTYIFGFGDTERPAYDVPLISELMEIDFLSFPTANVGTTPSVFYVYPTMVNGETSFELKGLSTQSGEMMVQPVKMRLKKEGTAEETKLLPINANTRYIINILAAGSATVEATITVKEWQIGENFDVEAGYGKVKMTLAEGVENGATLTNSNLLNVPETALAAFNIAVAADTEWEIVSNTVSWITISNEPAAAAVGKEFTIEINEKNPSSEARQGILYIRNVKRPSIVQALTVVQAANAADGFKIEGDKLEENTLRLFGSEDKANLTLTLPEGVTQFECAPTSAGDWLTVTQTATRSFDGSKKLIVSATANPTDSERAGTLTLTVGETVQTIAVKQAPRNLGSIKVDAVGLNSGKLLYADNAKTGLSLLVKALTKWEVTAVDLDADGNVTETTSGWITGEIKLTEIADPKANYNGKYDFALSANTTGIERKSQVTLSNKYKPEEIKSVIIITQMAAVPVAPVLSISDGTNQGISTYAFAVDATAETVTEFTITATEGVTTGFSVEIAENDWLTLDAANVSTTGKFTITCTGGDNSAGTERSATVTVKVAGAQDKTFTVTQPGAEI